LIILPAIHPSSAAIINRSSACTMVYYYERFANLAEEEGAHEKTFYSALEQILETKNVSRKLFCKENKMICCTFANLQAIVYL
jgi:hypothetical protein